MNTTLQVRIDSKIKKDVAKIFESLGLDMSSGIKMFFNQVLIKKGIPFSVRTENGYTSEFERRINSQSEETMALYRAGKIKAYDSWGEAKKAMLSE